MKSREARESIGGNIFSTLAVIGGIFLLSQFAFSKKQRDAIILRDENTCQATVPHGCNAQIGLEVDHIIPQRYASMLGIDPDFPENALSKCKNAHNIKHPDRVETLSHYHEDKAIGIDSFQVMSDQRDEKLNNKEIYWNPDYDRTDSTRAIQLTQRARAKGWEFPDVKHKKT